MTTERLDKWLWHARFFKTRGLARRVCEAGKVRINGERTKKAHHQLRVGDVLTFAQAGRIRVIGVRAIGVRRGPAREAATLYLDMDAEADLPAAGAGPEAEQA